MLYQKGIIKIDKIKYDNNQELLNKVLPKIIDITSDSNTNKDFIVGGTCTFFNSDPEQLGKKLFLWEEFKDYIEFIKPHIRNYLNEINKTDDYYYVTGMWANNYPPGTCVTRHSHLHVSSELNDVLAILLYLKKPEGSGNLIIEIPEESSIIDYQIEMTEGDVVLFQSSLYHRTEINQSNENKFVIGIEMSSKIPFDEIDKNNNSKKPIRETLGSL